MVVTIIAQETRDGATYPITKVFRFEFESAEDAMNFIDTGDDIRGLVHAEQLTGKA